MRKSKEEEKKKGPEQEVLRSYHASMRSPSTFSLSIAVRSASLSSSSMLSSFSRDSSCTDS
jgi:hypothetical protein